jgi:peptidoglycan hydrolase-like protein with peptidoglycan-binding domain
MSNPLLDLIVQGESGAAGYNAYNRGTYVDSNGGKHIRGPNGAIDFSGLTVGQVHDRQHLPGDDSNRLFAVGKYQVIPATMDGAINKLNLDRNEAFTPALQDKVFSEYLIVDKRPDIQGFITGKPGVSLRDAQHSLALEWASFGDPDKAGASHYGGANHASITLAQSEGALNRMRASYAADIARGLSAADAWKDVTASNHAPPAAVQREIRSSEAATRHHSLQQNDQGEAVRTLQTQLSRLGYTDASGHALQPDSDFGPDTRHALETFQRDHHLKVDGIDGAHTNEALDQAMQAKAQPQLDEKNHAGNPLFLEAQKAVYELDRNMGRTPDRKSDQLAGAAAVAAQKAGLEHITQIVLSEDGSRAFAVQAGAVQKLAHVQTAEAVNTTLAQSSQAWTQQATQ